ncbi:sigma-70 family RNA polymerase sigma factor [candidate division WOR-3 bacterium]|nr:sigma-70 family RNA polymerase sigma factor [candidate division WOR-3 bacterium]MCK4529109.1 sigma-70 family RNA polymerase sigma factor [candidate division WOR-3 bacterium]
MEDAILIKKCQRGDIEAYGELVEKYMKRAYNSALFFTRNPHDAWDVSQQGFLNAWKAIKRFDISKAFFPWLYTIIRNESMKHLHREKKTDGLRKSLPLTFNPTPEELLEKSEQAEKLKEALERLDEEKQEIIYLRHFAEMSYKEIAEVLNLPEGTVMSRLYYARKTLLEEYLNG